MLLRWLWSQLFGWWSWGSFLKPRLSSEKTDDNIVICFLVCRNISKPIFQVVTKEGGWEMGAHLLQISVGSKISGLNSAHQLYYLVWSFSMCWCLCGTQHCSRLLQAEVYMSQIPTWHEQLTLSDHFQHHEFTELSPIHLTWQYYSFKWANTQPKDFISHKMEYFLYWGNLIWIWICLNPDPVENEVYSIFPEENVISIVS